MLEHLPREIHVHRPDGQCFGCGGELRHLGDDVAEVLEFVPAHFKVIRHVRPRYFDLYKAQASPINDRRWDSGELARC